MSLADGSDPRSSPIDPSPFAWLSRKQRGLDDGKSILSRFTRD